MTSTVDHSQKQRVVPLPVVVTGSVIVGVVLGLVLGHALTNRRTAEEFNALGTWLASFATLAALLLAYVVHRRDAAARENDRTREQIREFNAQQDQAERKRATSRLEEGDARLVTTSVVVGSSSGGSRDDVRLCQSLSVTIMNRSTEPATDVVLRTRFKSVKPNWLVVDPTSRVTDRLAMKTPPEIPIGTAEGREFVQEGVELRFTMHKRQWTWTPGDGLTERLKANSGGDTA